MALITSVVDIQNSAGVSLVPPNTDQTKPLKVLRVSDDFATSYTRSGDTGIVSLSIAAALKVDPYVKPKTIGGQPSLVVARWDIDPDNGPLPGSLRINNADGSDYFANFDVAMSKVTFASAFETTGNAQVGGTLTVTGAAQVASLSFAPSGNSTAGKINLPSANNIIVAQRNAALSHDVAALSVSDSDAVIVGGVYASGVDVRANGPIDFRDALSTPLPAERWGTLSPQATSDDSTVTLATIPIQAGQTMAVEVVVFANLVGDYTNPNPAPSAFSRVAVVAQFWSGLSYSGAAACDEVWPSQVAAPFDNGSSPFHTSTVGSVMITYDGGGTNILVKARGLSDSLPAWATGTPYTAGTLVSNSGNIYFCLGDGVSAAMGAGPTTTAANIADNTTSWAYIAPFGDGPTVAWSGSYRIRYGQ